MTVIVCAVALSLPAMNALAAVHHRAARKATHRRAAAHRRAAKKKVITLTKTVTGPTVTCHKWGPINVVLKIRQTRVTVGASTKVAKITILDVTEPIWPQHTVRSQFINRQALPLLNQELLQIQSGKVETISGATNTSDSFTQSLQGALALAAKP